MDMIRHDDVLQDRHAVKMPRQVQQVLFGDATEGRQFQGVSYGGRVPAAGARHGGVKTPPYDPGKAAAASPGHTSRYANFAFLTMNWRRGSTCSPIRMLKASSARSASSILICTITRLSGFIVVSHSWSGFISPRPL